MPSRILTHNPEEHTVLLFPRLRASLQNSMIAFYAPPLPRTLKSCSSAIRPSLFSGLSALSSSHDLSPTSTFPSILPRSGQAGINQGIRKRRLTLVQAMGRNRRWTRQVILEDPAVRKDFPRSSCGPRHKQHHHTEECPSNLQPLEELKINVPT